MLTLKYKSYRTWKPWQMMISQGTVIIFYYYCPNTKMHSIQIAYLRRVIITTIMLISLKKSIDWMWTWNKKILIYCLEIVMIHCLFQISSENARIWNTIEVWSCFLHKPDWPEKCIYKLLVVYNDDLLTPFNWFSNELA